MKCINCGKEIVGNTDLCCSLACAMDQVHSEWNNLQEIKSKPYPRPIDHKIITI